MDINLLYKGILTSLGYQVDEKGKIFMMVAEERFPATVNGVQQLLPTHDNLKNADFANTVFFHPLSENVLRGESAMINKLKSMVNFRLGSVIMLILENLISIAANPEYAKKLTPEQHEVLSLVPDVNHKTVEAFEKVFDKINPTGEHRLVNVYLKRSGQLRGQKHSRVAVMAFPITDEFESGTGTIFGVTVNKKTKKAMQALFEYILPRSSGLEEYSFGSDSLQAVYFHALMKAYVRTASQLNKVTQMWKKHLTDYDDMHINLDFAPELDHLNKYKDLIPPQPGNIGDDESSLTAQAVTATKNHVAEQAKAMLNASVPTAAVSQPPASQPHTFHAPVSTGLAGTTVQPQQAPAQKGAGIAWSSIVAQNPVFNQGPVNVFNQPQTSRGGYNVQPPPTQFNQFQTQPQYGHIGQPQQTFYTTQPAPAPVYTQPVVYPGGI